MFRTFDEKNYFNYHMWRLAHSPISSRRNTITFWLRQREIWYCYQWSINQLYRPLSIHSDNFQFYYYYDYDLLWVITTKLTIKPFRAIISKAFVTARKYTSIPVDYWLSWRPVLYSRTPWILFRGLERMLNLDCSTWLKSILPQIPLHQIPRLQIQV